MKRGSLPATHWPDRSLPFQLHYDTMVEMNGLNETIPHTLQFFAHAAQEHMDLFGTERDHFSKIAAKNRKHAENNPYSQFQKAMSLEQINADKVCSECSTMSRMFRMFENVQNVPKCSECSKMFRMFQNVQNVPKCSECSRIF